MNSKKRAGVPMWCLLVCLVAGLTLLAATTCPHVSWFGQITCGTMGIFLLLAAVAGLLGPHNAERLAHTTQAIIRTAIDGKRHLTSHGADGASPQDRDCARSRQFRGQTSRDDVDRT